MVQEPMCASFSPMAWRDIAPSVLPHIEPFLAESFMGGTLMSYILMMVALVGVMYFLVIRPQNKKLRLHNQMISALKRGDKILLNSGLIGKIHRIDNTQECIVELTEAVRVRVVKQHISARYEPTEKVVASPS